MKAAQPDMVFSCVLSDCENLVRELKAQDFTPKATLLPACISETSAVAALGSDSRYLMGGAQWHRTLGAVDSLVGWDSEQFALQFEQYVGQTPHPNGVAAAAAMGILVQAIQGAGSIDSAAVVAELANRTFRTFYGDVHFDEVMCGALRAP